LTQIRPAAGAGRRIRATDKAIMSLRIPSSLGNSHASIRAALKRAMRETGSTGEAARQVARLLEGHMMREEKFAFRPLGLLPALARGETPAELADAQHVVEELRREVPQMREEHRRISEALRALVQAAEAEGRSGYGALAEELIVHQQIEEDVIYPAALLVGAYARQLRK
jgi:hypothetical protein